MAIYGDVLVAGNIEKQVHWNRNGQLVGPHLWRVLLLALRSYLCGTQGKSHRTIISSRFPGQKYSPSLEALAAIAPLMRATKLLTAAELDFLETNCAVLGQTWRYELDAAHGEDHTLKVHLIVRHVAEQARSEARHSRCVWRRGRRGRALGYDAGGSAVRMNENPTSKASGDNEAPRGKTKGKADSACEKKSADQKEAPELCSGGTAGRRRRAVKFVVG